VERDLDVGGSEGLSGEAIRYDRHVIASKSGNARELLARDKHEVAGDLVGLSTLSSKTSWPMLDQRVCYR